MIVYKITNKINGKVYIGQTLTTLEKRFYNHLSECKRSRKEKCLITKAIIEFGADNFIIENIYEASSVGDLNKKESEYILKYNSNNPDFGYNQNTGGKEGYTISDDVKKRISDGVKKYTSLAVENRTHPSIGRVPTIEKTKKASSKLRSESNSKNIPILKCDLNGNFIKRYYSMRNAARELGLSTAANIVSCCKGRINSAYGFVWKYEFLTMV